ncbi:MAG: DUF5110 domain-containing protein [Opitutales bacterium]|nr:DUF5110 domain-containing protein [Opitutales bacterium]
MQASPSFQKLHNGIGIRTAKGELIHLEIFSESIIGVRATTLPELPANDSFMVVKENAEPCSFECGEENGVFWLSTAKVKAVVCGDCGQVSFFDKDGKPVLREVEGSRKMTPVKEMGEDTFRIGQKFHYDNVNVLMGLGGHQDGIANYKGKDCNLTQYNCIDIVTYFSTDANYGLLWDNDSITKFGDPREHGKLGSVFKLYNEDGVEGGLTARYYGDSAFAYTQVKRDEDQIEYSFFEERPYAPKEFNFDKGSIKWTGFIEAPEDGVYKLRSYGSHYIKVTIDGVEYVNKWRQNWMPWQNLFEIPMKAGQKLPVTVEWNANGGFCALQALSPACPCYKDEIALESEVGEQVRYYFIYGESVDEQIAGYRKLTGKATMLPRWTMGLWQSRERYETQKDLLDVCAEFRKREIPLDCIVQDWQFWGPDGWGTQDFDPKRFPDPDGMIRDIHEKYNAKLLITVWAKFNKHTEQFKHMYDKGWIYKKQPDTDIPDWLGYPYGFYDAFNEDAGRWFWDLANEKLFKNGASNGADAWWLDATEPDIVSNVGVKFRKEDMNPTAKGSGARVYNAFSINQCRWVYEGQRAADESKRVVILTRSSYAGHQRYGAATWSGDVASRWEDLKKQIPCGLNFCASGIPYWTTDIGGFAVEPRYERPIGEDVEEFRELQMRWYQFGVFNPFFRVHGQFPFREVFRLVPEEHPVYKAMVAYNKLRYRLMPYLYSMVGAVTQDDYTMLRALFMDFPQDAAVRNIEDEFMFGPAFLVAPVTDYKARSRQVYLPAGATWYDFHTNKQYLGGQTITVEAPLEEVPLFVRAGSIIPFGPEIQYANENPEGPVQLRVYPGADGKFSIYQDEGDGYGYEKGAFSRSSLVWDDAKRTLSISAREGSFPGMAEKRTLSVVLATEDKAAGKEISTSVDKTLTYSGEALSVVI